MEAAGDTRSGGFLLTGKDVPEGSNVLLHRPYLRGRKEVAAYLRASIIADESVILRAVLVDDQCRPIRTQIVARGKAGIDAFDPSHILDDAFMHGASGIILVRGAGGELDARLSIEEVNRAMCLWRRSDRVGIPLLDYVLVADNDCRGLFAVERHEKAGRS